MSRINYIVALRLIFLTPAILFVFTYSIIWTSFKLKHYHQSTTNNVGENTYVSSSCKARQNNILKRIDKLCKTKKEEYFKNQWITIVSAIFFIEPENKFAYCHVPKAASTLWMNEFAQMNHLDERKIKELIKKNSLHDFLMTSSSSFSIHLNGNKNATLFNKSQLYKFTFIRHPFERLVSAYNDKFVITPQANIVQPIQEYYEELYGIVTNVKKFTLKKYRKKKKMTITFEMFVDYLIHEINANEKINGGSIHWWPFTNVCKMCDIKYDFVGKLDSFNADIDCFLHNFPNSSIIHGIRTLASKKINSAGGVDSKSINLQYFSQIPHNTRLTLYNIFKDDFVIGDYKYPQDYIESGTYKQTI